MARFNNVARFALTYDDTRQPQSQKKLQAGEDQRLLKNNTAEKAVWVDKNASGTWMRGHLWGTHILSQQMMCA